MSGYEIDFTDQNSNRAFEISEYTTNGPRNPNDSTLDDHASTASTSLVLLGKGMVDYGEYTAENFISLLDNFSSTIPPVYPSPGQMWNDRSGLVDTGVTGFSHTPSQLRVVNDKKYKIIGNSYSTDSFSYFTLQKINPDGTNANQTTEERDALITHLEQLTHVRIRRFKNPADINDASYTDADILEQEDHVIVKSSYLNPIGGTDPIFVDNDRVVFKVSPVPSSTRLNGLWHVGGWEYVLQNNAPLHGDLDANDFTIVNLADPTDQQDPVTKSYLETYVASEIGNVNSIEELTDTVITTPQAGDVLIYDTSGSPGNWVNSTGEDYFVRTDISSNQTITGGLTLGGILDMDSFKISNLAYSSTSTDAATVQYVLDQIALLGGGGSTTLDGLVDTNLSSPQAGDILVFNPGSWENITPASFATTNGFITTAGGTMYGHLAPLYNVTGSPPTADTPSNAVVPRQYVDDLVASALTSGDTYVNNGSFDSGTSTLTLNLTNGASDVDIDMTGAGGNSTGIVHTVAEPSTDVISGVSNRLPFHEASFGNFTYPDIPLDLLLKKLNTSVGTLMGHNERLVFDASTLSGENLINLDVGSIANQLNPTISDDNEFLPYYVETNKLSIHVNGIKNVASTRAFADISAVDNTTLDDYDLYPGTRTGITVSTTLTVTVAGQYNGSLYSGSAVNIIIPAINAASMGDIVNYINQEADNNFFNAGSPANPDYAFGAIMYNGSLRIYSGLAGTGSSVTVSGTLISALVGAGGSPLGPMFTSTGNNNVQTYTPTNYQYIEEGRPFGLSTLITMLQLPPDGATIEIIKQPYVKNLI